MISMSKLDMVKYLRDCAYSRNEYFLKGNIGFLKAFYNFKYMNNQLEDFNDEYFVTMNRVFSAYTFFRMFSIHEDFFLNKDDYINSKDLENFKHNCTFYLGKNVTTKRIIQSVRNSFNHDVDENTFNISKNGKNFEIYLPNTRTQSEINKGKTPKPLHIRFNIDYIKDLWGLIYDSGRNIMSLKYKIPEDFDIKSKNLFDELDKVIICRNYFPKKLTEEEMNTAYNKTNFKKLFNEGNEKTDELINKKAIIKEFKFDTDQKEKIIKTVNQIKKDNPNILDYYPYYINIFNSVSAIPSIKQIGFEINYTTQNILVEYPMVTFDNYAEGLYQQSQKEKNVHLYYYYDHFIDGDYSGTYPFMLYVDSVINHLCDDEIINIDGVDYKRNKLRNSLSHGRWYITANEEIAFFDADTRNINDQNLRSIGKIKKESLVRWANEYIEQKELSEKNKQRLVYKSQGML